MPRSKKPLGTIDVELLIADQPTRNNRVYTKPLIEKLAADINTKPITIEEVSPLERKLKKVPVCYSWPEHAMATSTKAEVVDNRLMVSFDIKNNKYGTLLKKSIEAGVGFMPVGIGDEDENGVVTDYTVSYVAIDAGGNGTN